MRQGCHQSSHLEVVNDNLRQTSAPQVNHGCSACRLLHYVQTKQHQVGCSGTRRMTDGKCVSERRDHSAVTTRDSPPAQHVLCDVSYLWSCHSITNTTEQTVMVMRGMPPVKYCRPTCLTQSELVQRSFPTFATLELFPLPSSRTHTWTWLNKCFKHRSPYQSTDCCRTKSSPTKTSIIGTKIIIITRYQMTPM